MHTQTPEIHFARLTHLLRDDRLADYCRRSANGLHNDSRRRRCVQHAIQCSHLRSMQSPLLVRLPNSPASTTFAAADIRSWQIETTAGEIRENDFFSVNWHSELGFAPLRKMITCEGDMLRQGWWSIDFAFEVKKTCALRVRVCLVHSQGKTRLSRKTILSFANEAIFSSLSSTSTTKIGTLHTPFFSSSRWRNVQLSLKVCTFAFLCRLSQ